MGSVSVPVPLSAPVAVPVFPVVPAVPVASGLVMTVSFPVLCAVLLTVSAAMGQNQLVLCGMGSRTQAFLAALENREA